MTAAELPHERVPTTTLGEDRCHLGEGPAYDGRTDTAWWFDILERKLYEAKLGRGEIVCHSLSFMASALGYIDDARQLLVAENGLYVRNLADGRLKLLKPLEADNPATRSNDSRVHPSGTFWIGTMGRSAEPGAGAIYAFCRGELTRLFAHITIPNAICFTPDGSTGYFTDTRLNVLNRVALDPATGLPTGAPSALYVQRGQGGLDGPWSMPMGSSGSHAGAAVASMPTRLKESACEPCTCRRVRRAARSSSGMTSAECLSPLRTRGWTKRGAPQTPSTAEPSCSMSAPAGCRSPA
jgi:SMP-30/gluconolaconase/LRE-like protein